jgi:outer membrane protein
VLKNPINVLVLTLGLALSAAGQTPAAQSPAAESAGPMKIAVIPFQAVVAQTNEGQRDLANIEKKFQPRTDQLKALNSEIEGLEKDLQSQADKLTGADRASRAKTIDEKKKRLQHLAEELRNDGNGELKQVLGDLAPKVYDVMVSYAKQQRYTVVFDAGQEQPLLLYASESVNISKPVIDAYNTKSGVPAPPASAPKQ